MKERIKEYKVGMKEGCKERKERMIEKKGGYKYLYKQNQSRQQ